MSVAAAPMPKTYRFSRDEFYRLVDLGFFDGVRVELIDGEVVEMPAQSNLHALAIKLTEDALNAAFGAGHWVRVQMPLDLSPYSSPDPDLAVIAGSPRTHSTRANPTSALLVVEVSESSLSYDRLHTANLYAAAGVADYWIVNLVDRQVEVRRNPVADAAVEYGHRFAALTTLHPGDVAVPLAQPNQSVAVSDLLP
jgi:Uma2 family endonuclease